MQLDLRALDDRHIVHIEDGFERTAARQRELEGRIHRSSPLPDRRKIDQRVVGNRDQRLNLAGINGAGRFRVVDGRLDTEADCAVAGDNDLGAGPIRTKARKCVDLGFQSNRHLERIRGTCAGNLRRGPVARSVVQRHGPGFAGHNGAANVDCDPTLDDLGLKLAMAGACATASRQGASAIDQSHKGLGDGERIGVRLPTDLRRARQREFEHLIVKDQRPRLAGLVVALDAEFQRAEEIGATDALRSRAQSDGELGGS